MNLKTATLLATAFLAARLANVSAADANDPPKPSDKMVELFGDTVVAKGPGFEIKRSRLDADVATRRGMYAAAGMATPANFERRVLADLIHLHLILSRATEADKVKGREEFETTMQQLKQNTRLSQQEFDERLARQMKLQGLTRSQWEAQNIERATAQVVLQREIKVTITDDDARKYYQDHPARFEEPEKVRVSHILLATLNPDTREVLSDEQKAAKRKQAEALLQRLRDGEDFAKLAREHSEDPGVKEGRIELTFPRASADQRRPVVAEFESAAFALSPGQISDIVTTSFGYHLIKMLEKIPAKQIPFAEVSDQVKETLRRQEMEKQMPGYLKKLRAEAKVEILDDKLKLEEADFGPSAESAGPGGK